MQKASSVIKETDVDGADLIVEFNNGSCWRYTGAAHLEGALARAESKGAYFNANVRGKFDDTKF